MKVTSSKTEKRTAFLTIEVEPAEVEEYMNNAYKRMVEKVDVPGFRKGNAPKEVLEKHVGRDKLLEEARKELVPKICSRVIKEQGLKPLTQPMAKINYEEPMTIDMVVPLAPVVEIGDYRSIRMQPEPVTVTDKDIDDVLENIRQQYATQKPVDRPVKSGDIVTADVVGSVYETPFINKKGVMVKVLPEFPPEIPGLTDHFIGMKKGEEKEFKLKLPEDYPNKLVAEKEVLFKVKVIDIKEEKLPECNDSLVKMVAPDLTTMDDLRERIAKNMQIDYEQKANIKFEEGLMARLIEISKLEVPSFMVETETKMLFNQGLQQLQASCNSKQEYEERLKQISMEEVTKEYQQMAERRINWNLVLSEVAKAENISITNADIEDEIENMIQDIVGPEKDKQRQQMHEPQNRDNVKSIAIARKTINLLKDIAAGPEATDTQEDEKEDKNR